MTSARFVILMSVAWVLPVFSYDPTAGVDDWDAARVKTWVNSLHHTVRPYSQALEDAGITGHILLWLNEHHMIDELKLPDEPRKHFLRAIDRLKTRIKQHPNDFWEWRAGHRRYADCLVAGLSLCPRLTVLYLHTHEHEHKVLPIVNAGLKTGLGFWSAWLLCPRLELVYNIADMIEKKHPKLFKHAWIVALFLSAIEWISWILLVALYVRRHDEDSKTLNWPNPFGAGIGVGFYWVLYPIAPHYCTDMIFYFALASPYILILLGLKSVADMMLTVALEKEKDA